MLTLLHYKTKERISFNTPKELKEMLRYCNPTWLRFYVRQIEQNYPLVEIQGMGCDVVIVRKAVDDAKQRPKTLNEKSMEIKTAKKTSAFDPSLEMALY